MTSPSSTSTSPSASSTCAAVVRGTRAAHRSAVVRADRGRRSQGVQVLRVVAVRTSSARLTRRGRLVLLLTLVGLLLAAFSLGRADAPQAATGSVATPAVVQTVVEPGDSLWTVARRVAPQSDPREVVEQLRRLNDLSGSGLQVGQQLLLPA